MMHVLFGFADDFISEDDLYFTIIGPALDGLEAGFLGSVRLRAVDVALELAHEEKDPDDRERPHDEDPEKESLIGGHLMKSRV